MTKKQLPAREAIAVGRFSTDEQEDGDSIRRQQNSFARVCQRWELQPSNRWTIFDKGLSGFKGEHLSDKAELGRFLRELEAGQVRPDPHGRMPVLVWEAVDRMTRLPQLLATDLVRRFVGAGVAIVFDEADLWIDSSTIEDKWIILQVLIDQAYQYSRRLSRRLKSSWQGKREKAASSGERFGKRRPCWIDWDVERKCFVLNDGAEAIQFIFEKTAEGWGQRQVVRALQQTFRPIGPSGRWNSSFVQKVLSDRAVLGELQPCSFNANSEREPVGKAIPGYYPAAIENESLWYRAQAGKEARKKQKGPNSKFVNLFTGLLVNAHDRFPMHLQTSPLGKNKRQRRLVSYGHLSKVPGADSVSVAYDEFETAVLTFLHEVKPTDLQRIADDTVNKLRAKEQELAGVRGRIADLEAAMKNPAIGELPSILASVAQLEKHRASLEEEIDRKKGELHTEEPLNDAHDVLHLLNNAGGEQRHALRLRLRARILELVESVYIKPEKHYGRVYFLAQIFFKGGLMKGVLAGPGIGPGGSHEQTDGSDWALDLRNPEQCKAPVFHLIAKGFAEPAEVPIPKEIPGAVGAAADVWLLVAKSSMNKNSFRVVPSKIKRFVAFLGASLPCADLTTDHWRKWVRWLKKEVAKGRLAHTTAKVNLNRAREFVRWLVANGKVQVEGINGSAEAALA